jgi:hypothetical protein
MKTGWLFIILILLYFSAFSQRTGKSYFIKSFEGISHKIELSEADRGRTIVIKSGTNQLAIYDCYGVTAVHLLNEKFLEIVYEPRGGSGLTLYNVLILGVSKGKLITAMDINFSAWTICEAERKYSAKPTLTGDDNKGYKLSIKVHEEVIGKSEKWGGPYDKHKTVVLNFDPDKHIFYNGNKTLDQGFKFFDSRKPTRIKGNFPLIDINNEVYYFINGLWYALSHADDPPGPYQMKGDYLNAEVSRIH